MDRSMKIRNDNDIWTAYVIVDDRKYCMQQHVGIAISEMKDWKRKDFILYFTKALNMRFEQEDKWSIIYTDRSHKTKVDISNELSYQYCIKIPLTRRCVPDNIEITIKRKGIALAAAEVESSLPKQEKIDDMKTMTEGIALLSRDMNSLEEKMSAVVDMIDEISIYRTRNMNVLYQILETVMETKKSTEVQPKKDAATNTPAILMYHPKPCLMTNSDDMLEEDRSSIARKMKKPYENSAIRKTVFKRLSNLKNMSSAKTKCKTTNVENMPEVTGLSSEISEEESDSSDADSNVEDVGGRRSHVEENASDEETELEDAKNKQDSETEEESVTGECDGDNASTESEEESSMAETDSLSECDLFEGSNKSEDDNHQSVNSDDDESLYEGNLPLYRRKSISPSSVENFHTQFLMGEREETNATKFNDDNSSIDSDGADSLHPVISIEASACNELVNDEEDGLQEDDEQEGLQENGEHEFQKNYEKELQENEDGFVFVESNFSALNISTTNMK